MALICTLWAAGCQKEKPKEAEAKPPEIFFEQPESQLVTDEETFTGIMVAVNTIEIRARVSGYLEKVFFNDGDLVTEGSPLFEIDERPYRAEMDRSIATLAQAKSHLERLKRQEERANQLFERKSISEEQLDQARFDRAEAAAEVDAALASRETAELNLNFTKINSKITGRIGRRLVDPGNLVQADVTPLTTVVSLDPIYAYFDVDERTLLRLRRIMEAEHATAALSSEVSVEVTLADEGTAPMWGHINFLDNQVDPATGTLRARAVVDNPSGLLSPGLFVRLRVPIGSPQKVLLVHEEALQSDQGQRFVWVLDDEDRAVYRQVKIGKQKGDKRIILDGLATDNRVVVKGVQRVRRNKKVTPQLLAPGSAIAASGNATPAPAATTESPAPAESPVTSPATVEPTSTKANAQSSPDSPSKN
ncbi:MAG: efflux RND transporter periplasmic adaptor subunit [Planctomycetes bacterium]|nr:efflux RND transporter periplasmic adaptor subunit [Planctomycetota bacterium]